jgi:hypothetical protein
LKRRYPLPSVLKDIENGLAAFVERSGFDVRCDQTAIIFFLVIGIAPRNVCIGAFPKHQRP